jgi:hypothetical protein
MKAGFWVDFGPVMFSIELSNWKKTVGMSYRTWKRTT